MPTPVNGYRSHTGLQIASEVNAVWGTTHTAATIEAAPAGGLPALPREPAALIASTAAPVSGDCRSSR